jgi:hypothetical protein
MAKKTEKQRSSSVPQGDGAEQKRPRKNITGLIGNTFKDKPERINKKGRPKLISHLNEELKGQGYEPLTDSQLADLYKKLLQLPEKRLKELGNDPEQPYFLRRVIHYMASNKGLEMLDRIVDRSFGRPKQMVEASVTTVTIEGMSADNENLLKDVMSKLSAIKDENELKS